MRTGTTSSKKNPDPEDTTAPLVKKERRIIMVVDDDEDLLSLARIVLERADFKVETRTSAPDWQDLQQQDPLMVFMDINLGQENGLEACRAIKDNGRFLGLPVILISGMEEKRLANAVTECHADGFLSKPYSAELMVKLARHYAEAA